MQQKPAFLLCVKSVPIRSYSGPHFPAFGLNTEKMRRKCWKMGTRITPNRDTFYSVLIPSVFLNVKPSAIPSTISTTMYR